MKRFVTLIFERLKYYHIFFFVNCNEENTKINNIQCDNLIFQLEKYKILYTIYNERNILFFKIINADSNIFKIQLDKLKMKNIIVDRKDNNYYDIDNYSNRKYFDFYKDILNDDTFRKIGFELEDCKYLNINDVEEINRINKIIYLIPFKIVEYKNQIISKMILVLNDCSLIEKGNDIILEEALKLNNNDFTIRQNNKYYYYFIDGSKLDPETKVLSNVHLISIKDKYKWKEKYEDIIKLLIN